MVTPLTPEDLAPTNSFNLLAHIDQYTREINSTLANGGTTFCQPDSCYLTHENRVKECAALGIALMRFSEVGWKITETESKSKQDEGRITYHFIGK